MTTNTISAASNPNLAKNLVEQAMAEPEKKIEKATITAPSANVVTLPGGYLAPTGEVITYAEVRELTGKDEEAISRVSNSGRVFATVLNRAVVSLGELKANDTLLDNLLAGDRDALLLGVYKATFGPTADLGAYCQTCKEFKTVTVEIDTDIKTKVLVDKVADRTFRVQGKKNEFVVTLPTGVTQRAMVASEEKTSAEVTTILLENTILEINGQPVVSPIQVQNLGLVDRRKIVDEIVSRSPGPVFEQISVTCPDCEGEVGVPISLGALFRF